jgi:hypothetical protein
MFAVSETQRCAKTLKFGTSTINVFRLQFYASELPTMNCLWALATFGLLGCENEQEFISE